MKNMTKTKLDFSEMRRKAERDGLLRAGTEAAGVGPG